jgi:hypothetical protein
MVQENVWRKEEDWNVPAIKHGQARYAINLPVYTIYKLASTIMSSVRSAFLTSSLFCSLAW